MKGKVIFDGRNIYDPEAIKKNGFIYFGIGRRRGDGEMGMEMERWRDAEMTDGEIEMTEDGEWRIESNLLTDTETNVNIKQQL